MTAIRELTKFCMLANRLILAHYQSLDSCIFSTGVVCEVLSHFGFKAVPLRVEAAVFPTNNKQTGCILGSEGDGTRMPAASPGCWLGHLVSLIENEYLMDTTLDQANDVYAYLQVAPVVIYLPHTRWYSDGAPIPNPDYHCTGNLPLFASGSTVRYKKSHRQNGWKSAGDFQPCRRREIVKIFIEQAAPLFKE